MDTPLVFDGHNDTLLMMAAEQRSFFERSERGHIDLPRAREGGMGGGMCAVFVVSDEEVARYSAPGGASRRAIRAYADESNMPTPPQLDFSIRHAMMLSGRLFDIEAQSQGQVKVVRTAEELARCLRDSVFAAVLHFEGAEPIDPELEALHVFHHAGLRSLGLVWSRPNRFARGVPFKFSHSPDTGAGLTDLGRALVRECNALRILVDVSHLNEEGFWDVVSVTDKPIVASHSCVWNLCQSTRNLTDRQLDAIRDSDGLVGLNFHTGFLREDGTNNKDTPLSIMVRHIDYLVEHIGIDRVALGSDFDGATMPREIGDVSGLPRLLEVLTDSGYDAAALRKIAHENWVRVLRATWGQ